MKEDIGNNDRQRLLSQCEEQSPDLQAGLQAPSSLL